jgi:Tfp pilus assembly protein PilO
MVIIPKNWLKNLQKNKYLQLLPDFKEEKARKFITLILTLLTLSFFGIFAIGPTLSTISKLQKELEDNRLVENKLKQKINNLSVLQQKYADLQGSLQDVYDTVPKTPEVAVFIGQIEKLTQDNNVNITNLQTFQVEAVSKGNNVLKRYSSFNFNLSIEGDYENISSFLDQLTNMQRIVSLDTLSINNIYDRQKGAILRLSIKGTAYFKE